MKFDLVAKSMNAFEISAKSYNIYYYSIKPLEVLYLRRGSILTDLTEIYNTQFFSTLEQISSHNREKIVLSDKLIFNQ